MLSGWEWNRYLVLSGVPVEEDEDGDEDTEWWLEPWEPQDAGDDLGEAELPDGNAETNS